MKGENEASEAAECAEKEVSEEEKEEELKKAEKTSTVGSAAQRGLGTDFGCSRLITGGAACHLFH